MKKILFLLSVILSLNTPGQLSLNASAQTLSLDSCLNMALKNNKELQSNQLLAQKYKYEEKAYLANYFPNFKLVGNGAYTNSKGTVTYDGIGTALQQSLAGVVSQLAPAFAQMGIDLSNLSMQMPDFGIDYKIGLIYQGGVTIEQPIYMGGKVTAGYKMSKIGKEMAELGAQLSEDQVIVSTEEAYSLLVKANELSKVAIKYDSLLSQLISDVQSAERHGLRGHNDVLKVQVKKSESELQVRQAENAIRLAQMNLCHYVGLPLSTEVHVSAEDMDNTKQLSQMSNDITTRPEYQILQLKTDLAAQEVKLKRADFLPQVGLMAGWSYQHGLEIADKNFFYKPAYGFMLHVSVPLYHANEAQNRVKSAKIDYERAKLEQEDNNEKMRLELAQATNNLDEAFLELNLTNKNVEQAEDNLKSSTDSFKLGLESLSDHLEAQTLWQQAYAKNIEAKCKLFLANTKYLKACGQL